MTSRFLVKRPDKTAGSLNGDVAGLTSTHRCLPRVRANQLCQVAGVLPLRSRVACAGSDCRHDMCVGWSSDELAGAIGSCGRWRLQ